MATGRIIGINNKRAMVVVELDNGSYSVLEVLGYDDIEINITLKGAMDDEGSCTVVNLDTNSTIDVVVQNSGCTLQHALKRAQLR